MNPYITWIQQYKRSFLIVVVTLVLPFLIGLYIMFGFLDLGRSYQQEIDQLKPRSARLMGMVQSDGELGVSVADSNRLLDELIYPADVEVSATLQQNLVELINNAGMTVANSRTLPSVALEYFERVELRFTVVGSMAALDEVLSEFSAVKPLLLIESLNVAPNRIVRERPELSQQRVTATIVVLSLRALP